MPTPRRAPTKPRLDPARLGTRFLKPARAAEPEEQAGPLIAWYDAIKQTGYSNGNSVNAVTDFSGNSRDLAQGTGANQPTYQTAGIGGHPSFRHDGTNDRLVSPGFTSNAQPNTIVLVAQFSNVTGERVLIDGGSGARHIVFINGQWQINAGTTIAGGTPDTSPHILRALFNGASSSLWVDDIQVVAANAGTQGINGITIGTWFDAASEAFAGDWGEALVYDGDISATWTPLRDYLVAKWASAGPVVGAAAGAQRSSGVTTGTKNVAGAAAGAQRSSGADTARKQWAAAAAGTQRSSGQAATRKQAALPATAAQRTSGTDATRKQAVGVAQGRQRTSGEATRAPTGPSGAAAGVQRSSGTTAGVKTVARAAAGAQRTAAQTGFDYFDTYSDTYLFAPGGVKAVARAAAGAQRTSGTAASFEGGAAQGAQRTSGVTTGQHRGVGVVAGRQRSSGTAAGVHKGVGAAAGAQRSSGITTAEPSGNAAGQQRTSGTTSGFKTAARAAQGALRSSGVDTGRKQRAADALGTQRTSGVCVSRKTAAIGAASGQQRTSGAAVGIHRGIGVGQVRQRTSGTAVQVKAGRGAAVGQQRTSGVSLFTTVPPPRWVEHDSAAAGLVEGDGAGSGLVEGVLVGAGIVEGSSGL